MLDYYEHNKVYNLFKVFIILNEEENFEEQFDQRAINKDGDQYLFEKDIEHILLFTGRIKNEPEYAYPLELHSKEYLDLYYRFKLHLEHNVNSLRTYEKIIVNIKTYEERISISNHNIPYTY